jgi:GNAT superfamily N-acetyltransferase
MPGAGDEWPVSGYADLRLDSHPELRFLAATDGRRCSVLALADLIVCGSLRWLIAEDDADDPEPDAGMIGYVYVAPEVRRRGIATALLTAADAYAERYGLPAPRHTEDRSPSGDAWARSVGAEPAGAQVREYEHRLGPWGHVFDDDREQAV